MNIQPLPPPLSSSSNASDGMNLQQIRDRFKAIDRNGDGLLSKDELLTLLTHSGMESGTHPYSQIHITLTYMHCILLYNNTTQLNTDSVLLLLL